VKIQKVMEQNDRAEETHILQDIQKHGSSTSASMIFVATFT
jgi:hypothetical protein